MVNLGDPKVRSAVTRLMRLDKPIGTFLLLWPTLWALWFANAGVPSLKLLAIFVAGVWVMRSAGCVINDYNDRFIDAYVERTKHRPLATGELTPADALQVFALLVALAIVLVLFTNRLTMAIAPVALILAAVYPVLKRYVYFPQLVLGAAFGWSIPMAYTASVGAVDTTTWLLFIANVLWATAYDTIYAMVDRDDDLKIGVRSTAVLFGDSDRLAIGVLQLLFILALLMIGARNEMGVIYFFSILVTLILFAHQQFTIRNQYPDACFKAFLNNNYVGLVLFLGIAGDFWLQRPAL